MLRRSRFAHYYQRGDEVCIFHALSMEILFGSRGLLDAFLCFPAAGPEASRPGLSIASRPAGMRPTWRNRLGRTSARARARGLASDAVGVARAHSSAGRRPIRQRARLAASALGRPPKSRRLASRPPGARNRSPLGLAVDGLREKGLLVEHADRDERYLRKLRVRGETLHRGELSLMYLIPEARCNLQCTYCFIDKDLLSGASPMSESTARQAVRYFFRHSRHPPQRKIIFYGGEPLLNPAAVLAVADEAIRLTKKAAKGPKLSLSLLTNGLRITPDLARELAQRDVRVSVSLDGPREVHDQYRRTPDGEPTFDEAMAALGILRAEGLEPSISCTVTEASLRRWDDVLSLIVDELGLKGLGFNVLLPGPCPESTPKYADPLDPTAALLKAFRRFRDLGIYEDRVMRRVKPFSSRRFHFKDCLGVGGQIAVTPDGSVGPCQGFLGQPEYFPLDVFRDFGSSPYDHPLFREWTTRFPLHFEECLECPAVSICGGGCPLAALREEGSIWQIDRRICSQVKPIHEWLVWDLLQKTKDERRAQTEASGS